MTAPPRPRSIAHPCVPTHLTGAALRAVRAVVRPGGGFLHLRHLMPDAIVAEAEGQPPAAGSRVVVEYYLGSSSCRFQTSVLASGPEVRLALPTAVEFEDRRRLARLPVPRALGLRFCAQTPTPLHAGVWDITSAGIAITLAPQTRLPGPQHLFMGMLQTPGGRSIPVDLEIRNARPSPDGRLLILGTRLAVLPRSHRELYEALVRRCAADAT